MLVVLLCLAQWGVLQHGVEHPFHKANASCDLFIACDQTGHALVAESIPFAVPLTHILLLPGLVIQFDVLTRLTHQARGPPSLP